MTITTQLRSAPHHMVVGVAVVLAIRSRIAVTGSGTALVVVAPSSNTGIEPARRRHEREAGLVGAIDRGGVAGGA
jgi:hypothetical protein